MSPIDDPDAPPSAEELAASERLRNALEKGGPPSEDAELLQAVAASARPHELDAATHEAAAKPALDRMAERHRKQQRGVLIRVSFGFAGVMAAAAAIALWVGPPPSPAAELVRVRSTQELFSERFDTMGGESARIDRIAIARESDLRENRFARWGVGRGRRR